MRRARTLSQLIAAAALLVGCASQPPPVTKIVNGRVIVTRAVSAQAYEHAARALLYEEEGRWEEAAAEYQRALSYDGDAPELHARLAEVFLHLDRFADADEAIKHSLELGPTTTALLARAHAELRQAHAQDAVLTLQEARRLVSVADDVDEAERVSLELADAQLVALDLGGAAATLEDFCQAAPGALNARLRHAAVAWAVGDVARAEARFGEALTIEPATIEALLQLAWLRAALGRDGDARATFRQAVDRSEGALDVAVHFARWLMGKGLQDEARQLADDLAGPDVDEAGLAQRMELERVVKRPERALELAAKLRKADPDDDVKSRLFRAEGIVLADAGRTTEAVAAFLAVPESADGYHDARMRAAAVLKDDGKTAEAMRLLDQVAADDPDHKLTVEIAIARAEVDEKMGDPARAARRLEELATSKPGDARVAMARAAVEDRRGDWRRAMALSEEVLKRDEGNVEALNFWGFVAADHAHELPLAVKRLQVALSFEVGSGPIIDSVGWAHFQAGDLVPAGSFLEQAARLLPDDPEVLGHAAALYARRAEKPRAVATLKKALAAKPAEPVRKRLQQQLRLLEATEAAGR